MTTPQQSAIARLKETLGFNRQLLKDASTLFISSNLSAVGLFLFALSSSEKYSHLFSPEIPIASEIVFFGGLAIGLIEAVKMLNTQSEIINADRSKKDNIAAIIEPLTNPVPPGIIGRLTAYEAPIARLQLLLPSGQPDPDPMDLEVSEPNGLSELAGPRITALEVILKQLLDPKVKGGHPDSHKDRMVVLKELQRILAAPPRSSGLSLTGPEAYILGVIENLAAILEKAPETMVGHLELLRVCIEGYILSSRLSSAGKAMADNSMTAAIRAEFFTGVPVQPPIEEWRRAKELTEEEVEKVVLTEHQVIDFAKSLVALGNNRAPEVRKAFVEIVPGLKKLLEKEKQRLEQLYETNAKQSMELAVINRVLIILDISIDKVVDKRTVNMLNELFGNSLSGKRRIAPRDLMEGFEKSRLGSWSIENGRIVVVAENTILADALACAVVICYPHIPQIEICIIKDIVQTIFDKRKERVIDNLAVTPTSVFYFQRLIRNNRQYTSDLLKEQSPKAESMSPLPVAALLADVSV